MKQRRLIAATTLVAFLLGGAWWLAGRKGSDGNSAIADRQTGPEAEALRAGEDEDAGISSRIRRREQPNTTELKRVHAGDSYHEELWERDRLIFQARSIRSWSQLPDGSWIITAGMESRQGEGDIPPMVDEGGPTDLWRVKGAEVVKINPPRMDTRIALTNPDGTKVAFSGCYWSPEDRQLMIYSIYLMDLKTGEIVALTNGNERDLHGDYQPAPKRWSDDGKTLEIEERYGELGMARESRTLAVP